MAGNCRLTFYGDGRGGEKYLQGLCAGKRAAGQESGTFAEEPRRAGNTPQVCRIVKVARLNQAALSVRLIYESGDYLENVLKDGLPRIRR